MSPSYKQVRYVAMFDVDHDANEITFYPGLLIDDTVQKTSKKMPRYTADMNDAKEASLSMGAVMALCDQGNAGLEAKGMNRLRDKTS